MDTVGELLDRSDHVLLGFCGPLCPVSIDDRAVADRLKSFVSPGLPPEVAGTAAPFEVLRYAVSCGPSTAQVVERQLRYLETETVAAAPATLGAAAVVRRLAKAGFTLTVVSALSARLVESFVTLHSLGLSIRRIIARTSADTELLPPDPYLVHQAMRMLATRPERCLMVAGSVIDIQAARAAGVPVVAYAASAADADRFREQGAAVVLDDMAELTATLGPDPVWITS